MFLRTVTVGNLPKGILEIVKNELENLNIKCRIMPKLSVPQEAFNHWRKQYNAEIVMNSLSRASEVKFIDKSIPSLLITDVDLYYGGLNFVFGLEDPAKSCAIVSLTRLRPEFYDERPDRSVLEERVVKEVIHEIGHHLGLEHCSNPNCVMSFSPSVYDVDRKGKNFCENCRVKMMAKGINIG